MSKGRFGVHGGQYMPETLMNAVIELEEAYNHYKNDPEFNAELTELLNNYAGRPSRLYFAKHMTNDLGGAKIYLKREDLNHTGAHKINNVLGQALLAKRMGKTRLIAETGAGQHGVATATAAAAPTGICWNLPAGWAASPACLGSRWAGWTNSASSSTRRWRRTPGTAMSLCGTASSTWSSTGAPTPPRPAIRKITGKPS